MTLCDDIIQTTLTRGKLVTLSELEFVQLKTPGTLSLATSKNLKLLIQTV